MKITLTGKIVTWDTDKNTITIRCDVPVHGVEIGGRVIVHSGEDEKEKDSQ